MEALPREGRCGGIARMIQARKIASWGQLMRCEATASLSLVGVARRATNGRKWHTAAIRDVCSNVGNWEISGRVLRNRAAQECDEIAPSHATFLQTRPT